MITLPANIKTDPLSPYKGHYLVAMKRSGDCCVYKHRDYENPDLFYGYYIFEIKEDTTPDNLPLNFKYYKSLLSLNKKYRQLTGGIVVPTGLKLPDIYEFKDANIGRRLLKRSGSICLYKTFWLKSKRLRDYHVFKVKIDRTGNEQYPAWYCVNAHIVHKLDKAIDLFNEMARKEFIKEEKIKIKNTENQLFEMQKKELNLKKKLLNKKLQSQKIKNKRLNSKI